MGLLSGVRRAVATRLLVDPVHLGVAAAGKLTDTDGDTGDGEQDEQRTKQ